MDQDKSREPVTFRALLASRVRLLREQQGLLQEELADAGEQVGLKWTQPKVAAIEGARRAVTAEELLLLPALLGCSLAALLCDDEDKVAMTPAATLPCAALAELISKDYGAPTVLTDDRGGRVDLGVVTQDVLRLSRRFEVSVVRVQAAAFSAYQRSLRDERDARVDERLRVAGDTHPLKARLQALRGHVMRDIATELAAQLDPAVLYELDEEDEGTEA